MLIHTSSLDSGKIPEKLQCPGCAKFLLDGWKLPCCDQSVCATCESLCYVSKQLPKLIIAGHGGINDHCPICDHRPMSQDLCKPNKALRNTAKAFLKTAEKKLADERAKTKVIESLQAITPEAVTSTAPDVSVVSESAPAVDAEPPPVVHAAVPEEAAAPDEELPAPDEVQPSIEVSHTNPVKPVKVLRTIAESLARRRSRGRNQWCRSAGRT